MTKLVFTADTPREQYEELYKLPEGQIFKVQSEDFETVMQRIEDYKPDNVEFETFPVTPGTYTYSLTGPDHCVIVKNTNVTD